MWVFVLALLCLIILESPAGGKETHTHTRARCCKFLGYQRKVEYWHPPQWLHTIRMSHKANRRGRREVDWFIIYSLKKTTLMVSCQGTILLCCHDNLSLRMLCMPQHFQLFYYIYTHIPAAQTHTHTLTSLMNVWKSVLPATGLETSLRTQLRTKTHTMIRPRVCFVFFFLLNPLCLFVRFLCWGVRRWERHRHMCNSLRSWHLSHTPDSFRETALTRKLQFGHFSPARAVCFPLLPAVIIVCVLCCFVSMFFFSCVYKEQCY